MWKAAPGALVVVALLLIGGVQSSAAGPTPVTVECSPLPINCQAWYREPVTVRWSAPQAHGVQPGTCIPAQTLTGDTKGTKLWCVAWEGSSEDATTASITIRIDKSPPSVTAAIPSRPPDYGGWFNHPVSFSFTGTDAVSGIAGCSSAAYGSGDGAGVLVAGTCQDVAGNVGGGSFALNYDSTAPAAPDVTARPNDNRVTLRWAPPADAEMIEVARMTGTGLPALLFRGGGTSFTDRALKNGKRHRYLITSIDRAGNRAIDRASAVPTKSHLLSPADGARLGEPPLLLWEAVKRATYYNVQLYRGRKKVMTRWPRAEQLQLTETWRFAGERMRLRPGKYNWFIFPAFGDRSDRRFGKLLGKSSFRIVG
jgi:hypothetical protein